MQSFNITIIASTTLLCDTSGIVSGVFVEVVAGICERIPEPWCALRRQAGTRGMFGPADDNNTTADSVTADPASCSVNRSGKHVLEFSCVLRERIIIAV